MLSILNDTLDSKNSLDVNFNKSRDVISKDSQQTQSTAISVMIAVLILSSRSEIFWVCEMEPEYLVPHNSACKYSNPLLSSGLDILIVV